MYKSFNHNVPHYFIRIKDIGNGAYSVVYSAFVTDLARTTLEVDLPKLVAVKRAPYNTATKAVLHNEIDALKSLRLPHGINYYGCFIGVDMSYLYIIMDLIQGKDLFDLIQSDVLHPTTEIQYMQRVGLGYCRISCGRVCSP